MTRMATDLRQEQIIDKAMKIISEAGFPAFTTRSLAKSVGVSEPALYRHFKSKDEIVIGILKRMDDLWKIIENRLEETADYTDKMKYFIAMHFEYIEKHPDIVAVLFADEYIRFNLAVKSFLEEVQGKRYQYLVRILKEGTEKGYFKDFPAPITAQIILGTIRSVILGWRSSETKFSLTEYGRDVISTIIAMIS